MKKQSNKKNQMSENESDAAFYFVMIAGILFIGIVVYMFYKRKVQRKETTTMQEMQQETKQLQEMKPTQEVEEHTQNAILKVYNSNKGLRICQVDASGQLLKVINPLQ